MQIGTGKQGVRLGENDYSPNDPNGIIGYIEPACDNPQWIVWFTRRGDLILNRCRSLTGAVLDEAMKIKGRPDKPLTKAQRSEIARLKSPKMSADSGIITVSANTGSTVQL
jgi:hypothetical protein